MAGLGEIFCILGAAVIAIGGPLVAIVVAMRLRGAGERGAGEDRAGKETDEDSG